VVIFSFFLHRYFPFRDIVPSPILVRGVTCLLAGVEWFKLEKEMGCIESKPKESPFLVSSGTLAATLLSEESSPSPIPRSIGGSSSRGAPLPAPVSASIAGPELLLAKARVLLSDASFWKGWLDYIGGTRYDQYHLRTVTPQDQVLKGFHSYAVGDRKPVTIELSSHEQGVAIAFYDTRKRFEGVFDSRLECITGTHYNVAGGVKKQAGTFELRQSFLD
jgi:hypothetical protein